jgi:L-iditol 2-dehydrogenase
MKALVKFARGANHIEVREVEKPKAEDDEVMIKVISAGVCGTDLHIKSGEWPLKKFPVVVGHEFSGEIVEVGKNVKDFKIGELVVAEPYVDVCGTCEYCLTGLRHVCLNRGKRDKNIGAFAEYTVVPANHLHRVPKGITPDEAALAEPTAIVCHAVIEKGLISCNDYVAVVGPGPIGILSAQVARAAGAREVAVIGIRPDREIRLKVCQDLGFTTYEAEDVDVIQSLKGEFDFVVETSGNAKGIQLAIELAKKEKKIVVIGIPMEDFTLVPWAKATFQSINIIFSFSSGYKAWELALSLIGSQKIKLKPLITHRMPLLDWEEAFIALEKGKGIKAVLHP